MARAAGTYTAAGIAGVARSIKATMEADGCSYTAAAGRMMMAADLMWWDDERAAIAEAFAELQEIPELWNEHYRRTGQWIGPAELKP